MFLWSLLCCLAPDESVNHQPTSVLRKKDFPYIEYTSPININALETALFDRHARNTRETPVDAATEQGLTEDLWRRARRSPKPDDLGMGKQWQNKHDLVQEFRVCAAHAYYREHGRDNMSLASNTTPAYEMFACMVWYLLEKQFGSASAWGASHKLKAIESCIQQGCFCMRPEAVKILASMTIQFTENSWVEGFLFCPQINRQALVTCILKALAANREQRWLPIEAQRAINDLPEGRQSFLKIAVSKLHSR
jgi:hypothetical protein